MELLAALILGLLAGLASSVPIGPAEFWIIQALVSKKQKHIFSFILGIVLADLIYAHLAYWGYFLYFHHTSMGMWMKIASALFVIFIGLYQLTYSKKYSLEQKNQTVASDYKARAFLTGFTLCASNPVFILFWLYIVSLFETLNIEKGMFSMLVYYLGILLGDIIWYSIFVHYSKKGLQYFKSNQYQTIEQLINYSFILFGVLALFKLGIS